MLPPFEIDRARTPASVRQAPAGRANEHAVPRELNSLPRAAGSGTDSRLPRWRFTNDRRLRLLTFRPSSVLLFPVSPSSRCFLLSGPVRPPGGRYLSDAGSLRSAPVGRANNMLPNCGSTRCRRAAGSGTDGRLPRCGFTNDRRPRLLTFRPSSVLLSPVSPSSRHLLLCGPVRPPGGRYLSDAGSLRSAPVGRAVVGLLKPRCMSSWTY